MYAVLRERRISLRTTRESIHMVHKISVVVECIVTIVDTLNTDFFKYHFEYLHSSAYHKSFEQ